MLINILICVGVLVAVSVFAGLLLAVAEHYLRVKDDSQKHIDNIEFYLPSYNCGACGHVNCRQVAKCIVKGEIKDIGICKVITKDNARLVVEYCKENNIEIK